MHAICTIKKERERERYIYIYIYNNEQLCKDMELLDSHIRDKQTSCNLANATELAHTMHIGNYPNGSE